MIMKFEFWVSTTGARWFLENREVTLENYKEVCESYYNTYRTIAAKCERKWQLSGETDVYLFPECSTLENTEKEREMEVLCNNYLERLDELQLKQGRQ